MGERIARWRERHERIEARVLGRVREWSTRRRWVAFVLVPMLVFCCCGGVVGVPLVWFIRETIKAGQGPESPDVAASGYLMGLGYDNEDGLLPLLDDDHQDALLAQWREYRATMERTDPPPSRLDFGSLAVHQLDADHATVTTNVTATWWSTTGGALSYDSEALPWSFEAREDDGWRITAVSPPVWCGGYVRADACKP
jgi:hypothetical protein